MSSLKEKALYYHAHPIPGKTGTTITKPTETPQDLALAYSPGVAEPVREIANNPLTVYDYTNKGNLVAVITDGTAILGLGNLGPLAAKPVMEGKGVLFKRFAGIDVYDIEVNAPNTAAFIETVCAIAPTFGGINLEDIKAPECFLIEETLSNRLDIPVFHDDQHGTAIIVAAALKNAAQLQGKAVTELKIVCVGAGSAGIASMRLLLEMGVPKSHIVLVDRTGVVHSARNDLNIYKEAFAQDTHLRTLEEAMIGADVVIGVSGPGILTEQMIVSMASRPIIFALANPDPEIDPELVKRIRPDAIMATGRSDYPNQVNNVLCFPFLFRGALDVLAHCIHPAMRLAAVEAIAALAMEPVPPAVQQAYAHEGTLTFGPNYILPKPFDPRLNQIIPPLVAKAAIAAGVARKEYPSHYPK